MLRESSVSLSGIPTRIEGSSLPCREENFPYCAFGRAACAVYGRRNLAKRLARIGNKTDRAAKDWLSGKVPAPAIVVAALMLEISRPN